PMASSASTTPRPPRDKSSPSNMFATALIVLREVLEAALVVTLVLAAARGLRGRGVLVGTGIVAGILGAVVVAVFAGAIASTAQGMGQEFFNAGVLFTA